MKTFIFIPDTGGSDGFGHLFRCYRYSSFINKKNQIIFLINKNFDKNILIKNNQIKYIFFSNLKKTLLSLKENNNIIYTFLDSYKKKLHSIDYKSISKKHLVILDFKMQSNADIILDHTFFRKKNFHKLTSKIQINVGLKNFPFNNKISKKNKNKILINFGSIKNDNLINMSLTFLKNLYINKNYEIIIINKFFNKKNLTKIGITNKITCLKFVRNINNIYEKTFFSIGSCGISLYEKCFYKIPSISKCVAQNQYFNFVNFKSANCILDFDKIIKINKDNSAKKEYFFKKLKLVQKKIKKHFDSKKNKKNLKNIFNNL